MKLFEIAGETTTTLKRDIKQNKGRAVKAIVQGEKRRTNTDPRTNNDVPREIEAIS